mgnify:CR=1 FL=1
MIEKPTIAIVDYGVGNLYSLIGAFKFFGVDPVVTEDAKTLEEADGVVIPGVGSFEAGMKGLQLRGLVDTVKKIAKNNKPMLGICLGAQLMLSEGHEFGIFEGLGIMKGKVSHFPPLAGNEKVPQVGWNTMAPPENNAWAESILHSHQDSDQVYFVHSYILEPESEENILAFSTYGGHRFCSAIKRGNIYGFQFHPEKSGAAGLKLIDNFITLVKTHQ